MKIRPKIPMLQGGNNIWYNGIQDYDPARYTYAYDTSRLVNPLNFGEAWESRTNGQGRGRYVPNPSLSREQIDNIEKNNSYYRQFTEDLFNTDGTLSDVGKAYARLSDNLLPENSLARVYNGDQIRNSWTTTNNDTYGRPGNSFNNVQNYLRYERNDNLPGGRHNVFLKKGKRYFYVDNEGKYHWVSPEDAVKYQVTEKPVEYGWGDDGVYWEDYELRGLKSPKKSSYEISADGGKKYGFDWNKIKEVGSKIFGNPDLYAFGRLAGNLINNERVYDEQLKGIKPTLRQTYNTHRQIVGDEATKQAYYRRAAQGQTRAAKPFTSDADRQMAYQFEAKRIGDELRAQGDLADNQEIRRTSDESNQHQWANTQRATEVANANIASINQANALKHNLLAQKHSAQWSSIDNFLQGIEYRKRQQLAEQQSIDDQIFLLNQSNSIYEPEYQEAYKKYKSVLNKHKNSDETYDITNDDVIKAIQEWRQFQNEFKIKQYKDYQEHLRNRNTIQFSKSGSKITHKKKDDLLYKSAKDVVEHFRKMSKLSLDAQNRKQPKIEKLTSHPKGKTRKYQQGGIAPFTVYKPVALGGETTTSSQRDTSSTKSSKGSDGLDLMKELFKSLQVEGLPSDVNGIYAAMNRLLQQQELFGNELSSDDISSMYLQQMQKINTIKFNKAQFDATSKIVSDKEAGSEFAIDQYGRIAVQNTETGKIEYKKWEDFKKSSDKLNPLTNNDLLNLRAYSPDQAFSVNLLQVASNATSMSEIAKFLKAQLPSIGSSERTIEGYTKQDSNLIKAGLQLLKDAPAGDYKISEYTKDQQKQAQMALNYLKGILPKNMRTLLQVNSELQGVSSDALIKSMIESSMSEDYRLEFDAVTGKASTKEKSGSSGGGDMTPAMAFFMGMGDRNTFVIQDKTQDGLKVNTNSMSLLDSQGHNLGPSTLLGISQSMYGSQLDMNSATMGDVKISPNGQNNVLISDGMIYSTELPIDKQAASQGIIKPDLSFLKNIEKADQQVRELGITNRDNLTSEQINKINKIYRDNNLPIIYSTNGNGKPILTSEYRRFAMFNGYATPDAFEGDELDFNDGALEVDDKKELNQFESMMQSVTKNEKYKLDRSWFGTDLYKGVVYIPMNNSTITALGGTGYKGTVDEYMNIDRLQQQRDNALKLGYNPGGNASLIK